MIQTTEESTITKRELGAKYCEKVPHIRRECTKVLSNTPITSQRSLALFWNHTYT